MIWVFVQAILFILLMFLPLDGQFVMSSWLNSFALFVSFSGLLILMKAIYDLRRSLSVAPAPSKNGKLQTKGIYKLIRHPMYLAVWFIFGGGVLRSGSYVKVILFLALIVFFIIKTKHEEKLLIEKYPGYEKYKKQVGTYCPKIRTHS